MQTTEPNSASRPTVSGSRQPARLTIRISKSSLSFSVVDREAKAQVAFVPYTVKSGMSMAANLRQAIKDEPLLGRGYTRVRAFIDAPVLLVPTSLFHEDEAETLYQHTFTGHKGEAIVYRVQPSLDAVAVFPVNKDLRLVLEDNFSDVRFTPVMQPVWNYMHQRNLTGLFRKLYVYFHDKKLDVFCFDKNRFRYHNSFETVHAKDALYYILFVWKQLALDQQKDELYLLGDIPSKATFMEECKKYVVKTMGLAPSAEFNRAPITEIPGMTFDLMTLYMGS